MNRNPGLISKVSPRVYRATKTSDQSITTSDIRINYDTVAIDEDGAITTGESWVFTARRAGYYIFNARIARQNGGEIFGNWVVSGTKMPDIQIPATSSWNSGVMMLYKKLEVGETVYVVEHGGEGTYDSVYDQMWFEAIYIG